MGTDADADPSEYEALSDAEVTLRENEHGLHIADDEVTGVSSQGPTPEAALENLAEAVASYREATADDPGDDWL
jgi:predicted RNase H-like HicB family nuclease